MNTSLNANFVTAPAGAEIPDLTSMTLMVRWAVSIPTLRKQDKKASREVEQAKGAEKGTANLTKALLKNCPELRDLHLYTGNARNDHYSVTLPWFDNGHRILTTCKLMDHRAMMGEHKVKIGELFDKFVAGYDWAVIQAQASMGGLHGGDDYPTIESLRHRFNVSLEYCDLPPNDFRNAPAAIAQEMMDANLEATANRYQTATNDLWSQLHDQLARFSKQLEVDDETGKTGKIFESTIQRNLELCDMLAAFNITNDSQMEEQRRRLERVFHGLTASGCKASPSFRAEKKAALDAAIAALPTLGF